MQGRDVQQRIEAKINPIKVRKFRVECSCDKRGVVLVYSTDIDKLLSNIG